MHILVTGGAGYIGSHTCKAIAARGWTPVAYDNLSTGHRSAVAFGPFVHGDIADTARVAAALQKYQVGAVVHFAGSTSVGESCQRPDIYYANNVTGTLGLLAGMRQANVNHLVFSSTCATYGAPRTEVLEESHPQAPINPYGASKWMVERILRDFCAALNLRAIALRYFNAAGADLDGDLGEMHSPETHLIPLALQAAVDGSQLTLHGTDYPTGDGTCVRDYVHVADLAEAHLLAIDRLQTATAAPFAAYNLGCGQGYSVQEVLDCVQQVTGLPLDIARGPRRPGDPAVLVADSGAARRQLDWRPQIGDLETMVASAYRFMQQQQAAGDGLTAGSTREAAGTWAP
jgi:UDP-glucose-4-epimerase GalE